MLDARFSHLYFYQNRLQRGLSAIAELLVRLPGIENSTTFTTCQHISFHTMTYSLHVFIFSFDKLFLHFFL